MKNVSCLLSLKNPTLPRERVRQSCWVSLTNVLPLTPFGSLIWLLLARWEHQHTDAEAQRFPHFCGGKFKVSSFQSSYTIADRNILWELIFLLVGQDGFSLGAVISYMLKFLPVWKWLLFLPTFLCVHMYRKYSNWVITFKWVKTFECDLVCCTNIFYLEAYGPAVTSPAILTVKFYIIVGGQKWIIVTGGNTV